MKHDNNPEFVKLLKDQPFKTAFKATLGFYAAQTLITVVGLLIFGSIIYVAVK